VISGAHAIIYSAKPEADRSFLKDVLGLKGVDVGGGWLVFGLPPSEVAVHPADTSGKHELFFLVANVDDFITAMRRHEIPCGPIQEQTWGRLTEVTLPGGGTIGVYQGRSLVRLRGKSHERRHADGARPHLLPSSTCGRRSAIEGWRLGC